MNKAEFAKKIFLVFEDRNIKEPSATWLDMVFESVKNIDSAAINQGFQAIFSISQKQWNEEYGFGGKPSISDFIGFFDLKNKPKSIEEIAKLEVEKILYESRYAFSAWKPENPTTIAVINSFPRGLKTIHFELFDTCNSNKKNQSFFKKELIEKWLNFHDMRKVSNENLRLDCEVVRALPNLKIN